MGATVAEAAGTGLSCFREEQDGKSRHRQIPERKEFNL